MAVLSHLRVAAPVQTLRRLVFLASRSYASAAAAELYDPDYYEDDESELNRRDWRDLAPMVDSVGSESARGVQWVLIGDTGAKKHVYAERLSKLLRVPRISMGSLVRQELNPRSSLYGQITNAVNEGKLVPEEIIFMLLSKRLEEGFCRGETGFILDGVPRTRIQAEILDQIADIDLVVNFKCTKEQVVNNDLGNGTSPSLSSIDIDAWKEKIHIYEEQNDQLEDYYRNQKKLLDFQVTSAPGGTWQGLLAALHLQHMDAISSSQKLTAGFV